MTRRLRIGISTCPNDTFAFHALLTGQVTIEGADLEIVLTDVQDLNERLAQGEFDVAKASFHAALHLAAERVVLPVGAALGFGVGPIVLARTPDDDPGRPRANGTPPRVLCPGAWTTATLLYEIFHHGEGLVEQTVFSRIMPAVRDGAADFGVCIHEGRFTYREWGLHLVEDLGATWEKATGQPVPLGCLLARRDLGEWTSRITAAIRRSIEYALGHREETLPTMRRYAAELSDAAIWPHVDLYVNDWTRDLRPQFAAVRELARQSRARGLAQGEPQLAE